MDGSVRPLLSYFLRRSKRRDNSSLVRYVDSSKFSFSDSFILIHHSYTLLDHLLSTYTIFSVLNCEKGFVESIYFPKISSFYRCPGYKNNNFNQKVLSNEKYIIL